MIEAIGLDWLRQPVTNPLWADYLKLLLPASYIAWLGKNQLEKRFGESDAPDAVEDEE